MPLATPLILLSPPSDETHHLQHSIGSTSKVLFVPFSSHPALLRWVLPFFHPPRSSATLAASAVLPARAAAGHVEAPWAVDGGKSKWVQQRGIDRTHQNICYPLKGQKHISKNQQNWPQERGVFFGRIGQLQHFYRQGILVLHPETPRHQACGTPHCRAEGTLNQQRPQKK